MRGISPRGMTRAAPPTRMVAARVALDGNVLDPTGIVVEPSWPVSMASDGSNYAIVSRHEGEDGWGSLFAGEILSAEGAKVANIASPPEFTVTYDTDPAIAF